MLSNKYVAKALRRVFHTILSHYFFPSSSKLFHLNIESGRPTRGPTRDRRNPRDRRSRRPERKNPSHPTKLGNKQRPNGFFWSIFFYIFILHVIVSCYLSFFCRPHGCRHDCVVNSGQKIWTCQGMDNQARLAAAWPMRWKPFHPLKKGHGFRTARGNMFGEVVEVPASAGILQVWPRLEVRVSLLSMASVLLLGLVSQEKGEGLKSIFFHPSGWFQATSLGQLVGFLFLWYMFVPWNQSRRPGRWNYVTGVTEGLLDERSSGFSDFLFLRMRTNRKHLGCLLFSPPILLLIHVSSCINMYHIKKNIQHTVCCKHS